MTSNPQNAVDTPGPTSRIQRRDYLKYLAAVATVATFVGNTDDVAAQGTRKAQPKPAPHLTEEPVVPRFNLQAGQWALLPALIRRNEEIGCIYFVIQCTKDSLTENSDVNSTAIVYGRQGQALDPNDIIKGTRIIGENDLVMPKETGGQKFARIGAYKIPGVEAGSAVIAMHLERGERLSLDRHMPNARILTERFDAKDLQPAGMILKQHSLEDGEFTNKGQAQMVMLILPPAEHKLRVGGSELASPEFIQWRDEKNSYFAAGANNKRAIFERLEDRTWHIYARIMADANGVKIDPKTMALDSKATASLHTAFRKLITPTTVVTTGKPGPNNTTSAEQASATKQKQLDEIYNQIMLKRAKKDPADLSYSDTEVHIVFKGFKGVGTAYDGFKNKHLHLDEDASMLLVFIQDIAREWPR